MNPAPQFRPSSATVGVARLVLLAALCWMVPGVLGQESSGPLKPPDRSSPRATLRTFLESGDVAVDFVAREYRTSPTRAQYYRLRELAEVPARCLDLSEVPPAARANVAATASLALYETLSRLALPPWDQVPDADRVTGPNAASPGFWTIPGTEISLVRLRDGAHAGEYRFSADTVARADDFYAKVRDLPYQRPVGAMGLYEISVEGGGWMIPFSWIQAMPSGLRHVIGGQAVWKWIALGLVLVVFALFLIFVRQLSHGVGAESPLRRAVARLSLPAVFLLTAPVVTRLILVQINVTGDAGSVVLVVATTLRYLAGAWISWRIAKVVAEGIIASPKIAPESIDAQLIRLCTRLLGLMVAATFVVIGAERLGIPVYGVVAGLGVGGLAIALAAQSTIENLIGGLSLFGDRPIRVGDLCKYGSDVGTVEEIGIRSTRIRGLDRTLTTVPNAMLSRMPILNFAHRDRMLLKTVIRLRHETTPEQLRYVLARLRELLAGHPRLHPEPQRARFTGHEDGAFAIEVFAYAMTKDWPEFLGIQEDVLLCIAEIVAQAGTAFACPAQTLYFNRDPGPDVTRARAAEAEVQRWREEGRLTRPNPPAGNSSSPDRAEAAGAKR